ncbi:MAG TPA: DNA primase [Arenicellales bacterium]|nr:DNA primase [Arenicellales bacterium]
MAGRIPQHFIDELMTRTDIVDIIDSRVPLKKAGREYKACCPFHDEKTPSFTVSQEKQFYHCFGCGAHGTAIGFLMEYEHMDFVEAVEHLAARHGLEVPREGGAGKPEATGEGGKDLLEVLAAADRFYREQLRRHPDAKQAIAYLKKRGLTGQTAARFGLGFAPDGWDNLLKAVGRDDKTRRALEHAGLVSKRSTRGHYDRFRNRIMFPIHDHRGRVVGFGGRVLGEGEPKYLNSPETPVFHKGAELYGLYAARGAIKEAGKALVVEGYMDVVALAQHGIDYAVGTLGTATTRAHLERVFRYCTEVVFCFDGDRAGRAAAWRALESLLPTLGEGRQASFLFLPEGDDPDSAVNREGREGFEQRIQAATPFSDFLLQHLSSQADISRMDGRARLIELARPLVSKIPDGALKELLKDQLVDLARTDRETVDRVFGGGRAAGASAAENRRPAKTAPRGPATVRQSPVRELLTLLLQHPKLAHIAHDVDELRELQLPGIELFTQVVHTVTETSGLTTGGLLERFREHEHHQHLQKLVSRSSIHEEREAEAAFRTTLARIRWELAAKRVGELEAEMDRRLANGEKIDDSLRKRHSELTRLREQLKRERVSPLVEDDEEESR